MADETTFGPDVPETTFAYNDFQLDPGYHNAKTDDPPRVWPESQELRLIVEAEDPKPPDKVRERLTQAVFRQVRTLELYRAVGEFIAVGRPAPRPENELTLYVILFPGEGKDNTGIKDLNDKVLLYGYTSRFMDRRNEVIRQTFTTAAGPGPRYRTFGQDYKSSFILAQGKKPEDVAKDLKVLDAKIVKQLVTTIDEALADKDHPEKNKAACRELKRAVTKKNYRFDYLFGSQARVVRGDQLLTTFLLTTEALKGAGLARYAVKAGKLQTRLAREQATGAPRPKPGHDDRGRPYDDDVYLRVSAVAPAIKTFIVGSGGQSQPIALSRILVDKVWTDVYLLYKRLYFGNPDVIRDVRKKALVAPTLKQGNTSGFKAQRDLLELWLIVLNLVDFVSGFLKAEFRRALLKQHVAAAALVEDLEKKRDVKWNELTPILAADVRQQFAVAQLGATSEFPFFAYSSDYSHQIFFTFDVRDLGVDLMLFYELANKKIVDNQLTDENLLAETLLSNDRTLQRKRDTYDTVVGVFQEFHRLIQQSPIVPNAGFAAQRAMGTGVVRSGTRMPAFEQSVRVMIGGDEIFVAAHPLYTVYIGKIIRELDTKTSGNQLLNLRAGVAFSSAERSIVFGPDVGKRISADQRRKNQIAHDKALNGSSGAPGILKPFERAQRRMERLIQMLLDSRDAKKNKLAPDHQKRLDGLKLLDMYARVQYQLTGPMPQALYTRLIAALRAEDVATALATGAELVDFDDNVIDVKRVESEAQKLEADLLRDVGRDNFQAALPPVNKIPKVASWILKTIDDVKTKLEELEAEDEKQRRAA